MPDSERETTRDKSEQERARDQLLRDYVDREHSKAIEERKKKNPSTKDQFMKELRGMVEGF